jgi:hypothetical protein
VRPGRACLTLTRSAAVPPIHEPEQRGSPAACFKGVDATPAYDTGSHGILPAGWRSHLFQVAVIGAVTAVVTLAALLPVGPAAQAQPRYYVTISQSVSETEAVVRESANGKVTGQVAIPTAVRPSVSLVTGAADDRSFHIGVYQDGPAGSLDLRLFRPPNGAPPTATVPAFCLT